MQANSLCTKVDGARYIFSSTLFVVYNGSIEKTQLMVLIVMMVHDSYGFHAKGNSDCSRIVDVLWSSTSNR